MQDERYERLRRKHDFGAWENRGTPGLVPDLSLRTEDLPGWKLLRESRNDAMEPPVAKSVWGRGDSADELIGIELYRGASLQSAHHFLIWLLDQFQGGGVKEQPQVDVGDIAFGISEPTMLLFARANYVAHVYNAGKRRTNVMEAARAIDQKIARMASSHEGRST